MRIDARRAVVLLALASCKPGPPPVQQSVPLVHTTAPTFDGFSLADPVGGFIDRFGKPCDSDPIDKERSWLFFWAGAEGCNEQKPFPEDTTIVVLTPYAKAEREQPMDLVAWFGGTYFNGRSTLKVRIGDTAAEVSAKLGEPTARRPIDKLASPDGEGPIGGMRQASFEGDIHVLFRDEKVVGLAVGKLKGGEEREDCLPRGYAHHLRYVKPN